MRLPNTWIVIPAFNEQSVLDEVLAELRLDCPQAKIVVVDDCSRDQTHEVAAAHPVHLLRHVVNLGQGASLRTGIMYSLANGAEIVVTFDADGQMDPQDVHTVVQPVARGECDVALGTRFAGPRPDGIGLVRRIVLGAAVLFTRLTSRLPVSDAHNGLRAFSRKAAEQIEITQNRMAHASEILNEIARLDLRWKEVPVAIRYTEYSKRKGQSSLAAIDIIADLFWGRR